MILLVAAVIGYVLNSLPHWLNDIHYLAHLSAFDACRGATTLSKAAAIGAKLGLNVQALAIPEKLCYGSMSVYRICLSFVLFHFLFALLMINVRSRDGIRYRMQHGWWGAKLVLIALLLVLSFVLNNAVFVPFGWLALIGAGIFLIVQGIFLLNFIAWFCTWLGTHVVRATGFALAFYSSLAGIGTAVMYILTLTLTGLMYGYFSSGPSATCWFNPLLVTVNLILVAVVTVLALCARGRTPTGGLLAASAITLYCTFVLWTALASEPTHHHCTTFPLYVDTGGTSPRLAHSANALAGVFITVLLLVYAALSSSSYHWRAPPPPPPSDDTELVSLSSSSDSEADNNATADATTPETTASAPPSYSYAMFHWVFVLVYLYLAMILTNWLSIRFNDQATADSLHIDQGVAAVWTRAFSALAIYLMYAWTLLVPFICAPRT